MAIYTYQDMFKDCCAAKPEGVRYLVQHFVPIIEWFQRRYGDSNSNVESALASIRASDLFTPPGPPNVREFVAALRQKLVAMTSPTVHDADRPFELEQFDKALESFTATERQFIWFETMTYSPEETAAIMNLEASTVSSARSKADDLLRQNLDTWSKGMVAASALHLRWMASQATGKDCLPAKAFIETIDGKITWGKKREYERHMTGCWYCVDQFSRMREADHALNLNKPLSEADAAKWWERLGVMPKPKTLWAKMFKG